MCRFLILDDTAEIHEIFIKVITNLGYKTHSSFNAFDALKILKVIPVIRAVFVDLCLPGMDGLTFIRKIKKIDPLIYTCAVTGYSDVFTIIEAREAGADDFLIKPFSIVSLQEIVESVYKKMLRWEKYINAIQ